MLFYFLSFYFREIGKMSDQVHLAVMIKSLENR